LRQEQWLPEKKKPQASLHATQVINWESC